MVPFLCFSLIYFLLPLFFFLPPHFFFFFLFSVEMCRQLVEKPRDAGEMLVRCGMRLPLGDPSQAGSE